jgi:hypothetical protein
MKLKKLYNQGITPPLQPQWVKSMGKLFQKFNA